MKPKRNTQTKTPARISGSLFAMEIDSLIIDVERAAEYHSRKATKHVLRGMTYQEDPEATYLIDNLVRYYQSMIIGGIKMISDTPSDKLKGYGHHDLTKFWISVEVHTAMDVLGEYVFPQNVWRKVFYLAPEKMDMMTKSAALEFSTRYYNYMKDTGFLLIQGVPHNDVGDENAMSCCIIKENEVEKLCTHLTADMPDAPFMATMFPVRGDKFGNAMKSDRIPVTMTVGTVDELLYTVSTLN